MFMKRIDISKWKDFQLGGEQGLFEIVKGKRLTKAQMHDGNINFIGASADNNGVTNHISNRQNIHPGNLITVAYNGSVGETFYQKYEFVASDDVNVLYPRFEMNIYIALFLCPIIRSVGKKYVFINKWKKEDMEKDRIYLPVTSEGIPDWKYMEKYMLSCEAEVKQSLKVLSAKGENTKVDISQWKEYTLETLFDITKGSRLTKADMKQGDINYVGASSFNNGITCKIGNTEHIHPAGTMTVTYNGSDIGRTFYQESPFWATDDVNVLYPKFELTKGIALFLAPIIKATGGNHMYKDKWQIDDMKTYKILLPSDEKGDPDWAFMEKYMKRIEKVTVKKIENIV